MTDNTLTTEERELRNKIKFSILVPFKTALEPIAKAEAIFEKGVSYDDSEVYDATVDRLLALINEERLSALDTARQDVDFAQRWNLSHEEVLSKMDDRIQTLSQGGKKPANALNGEDDERD